MPSAYELYADPSSDELESEDEDQELDEDERSSDKPQYTRSDKIIFSRFKLKRTLIKGKFRSDQYESPNSERISTAERFKRTFSHQDVKVHFVGVW